MSLSLHELARLALAVVARDGEQGAVTGVAEGVRFNIQLVGPDVPDAVPVPIATPALVEQTPRWRGAYHLKVTAPLTVLELEWNPDEPLRILAFSRGTWEGALADLAAGRLRLRQ